MCSRFWGTVDGKRGALKFEDPDGPAILAALTESIRNWPNDTYPNVAPTDSQGVIYVNHNGRLVMGSIKWGFTVPDRQMVVNARSESMLEKALFARHVMEKRCLIPVHGYYEWDEGKPKQPYCLRIKDAPIFAFAGIWREYVGEKQFVVVTTSANTLMSKLSDRMPCLVAPEDFDLWLRGDCDEAIRKVCRPYSAEGMVMYPVTKAMSNPKYKAEDAYSPMQTLFDLDDF